MFVGERWVCPACKKKFESKNEGEKHIATCSKVKELRDKKGITHSKISKTRSKKEVFTIQDGWDKLTHLFPAIKIKAEETVSIDEAVRYGFEMFKGILKYSIILFIIGIIPILLISESVETEESTMPFEWPSLTEGLAILFYVIFAILYFSLIVGVAYKFWVDILGRSRK